MKIAIISDIHDNCSIIDKFLKYTKKLNIKTVICCGDIGSNDTFEYLFNNYKNNIYIVLGNADLDIKNIPNKKNIKIFPVLGEIVLDKNKIAFIHNIKNFNKKNINKFNYIFYGHNHMPWIEKKQETIIANPGCLSEYNTSSFALLDTKYNKLELIKIN